MASALLLCGLLCGAPVASGFSRAGAPVTATATREARRFAPAGPLRSAEGEHGDEGGNGETPPGAADPEPEPPSSLWDRANAFLDTPILDANNRSDQGAVAEALKEFVRDEPELAQVTFSVAVVAAMVLATRLAVSL